jgi:hypothetical protein
MVNRMRRADEYIIFSDFKIKSSYKKYESFMNFISRSVVSRRLSNRVRMDSLEDRLGSSKTHLSLHIEKH